MKTLKSFGCSFVYGSELTDTDLESVDQPSQSTWPALIAKKLNLDYRCHAWPGQGNFKILCDLLANSYRDEYSIFLINWTWIDRFDYIDPNEYWQTLRPAKDNELEKFYYRNFHSQLCDMISNASYIVSAAEHLKALNCPYIMTYMDYNLLTPIDSNWHDPRYLEVMQEKLKRILTNFEDLNFVDWSRKQKFLVGNGLHPLEDAHQAAADYWLPAVKKLL